MLPVHLFLILPSSRALTRQGKACIETYPDMLRSSDIPIDHIIVLLIFFGVGLLIFIGALFFALFGIVLVAPYFLLVLVIIFVVIGLMSIGSRNKR